MAGFARFPAVFPTQHISGPPCGMELAAPIAPISILLQRPAATSLSRHGRLIVASLARRCRFTGARLSRRRRFPMTLCRENGAKRGDDTVNFVGKSDCRVVADRSGEAHFLERDAGIGLSLIHI